MTTVSPVSASDQVRTAFDFTVDKFPLSGPDGMSTPWYAMFRSDSGDVVGEGSVTDRYTPHQTEDVIALVDACESVFDEASQVKTHFRNGHYVSVAPSDDYRRSIYGSRDNIFPRLIIRGGYDRSAFNVTLGIYRDACSNLAMLRSVTETYQSIRHTSGLRFAMDELIAQFQTLKDGWQTLENLVHGMQAAEVSMVDFLNAVYPEPDADAGQRAVTIHKNRTEKIFKRLQRERIKTGRPAIDSTFAVSAWEAYNAIQGFNQWDAPRREGFKGEFDRILKASDNQAVRKAETLALAAAA
jgi:hypothetical protein